MKRIYGATSMALVPRGDQAMIASLSRWHREQHQRPGAMGLRGYGGWGSALPLAAGSALSLAADNEVLRASQGAAISKIPSSQATYLFVPANNATALYMAAWVLAVASQLQRGLGNNSESSSLYNVAKTALATAKTEANLPDAATRTSLIPGALAAAQTQLTKYAKGKVEVIWLAEKIANLQGKTITGTASASKAGTQASKTAPATTQAQVVVPTDPALPTVNETGVAPADTGKPALYYVALAAALGAALVALKRIVEDGARR